MNELGYFRTAACVVALLVSAGSADLYAQDGEPRVIGQPIAHETRITGGGPTLQILPGPAVFADRAMAMARNAPPEKREEMRKLARMGPFSNRVAEISGSFSATLTDRGPSGDAVEGSSEFTTRDGTKWRVVFTGVNPQGNPPMEPHWGGVATFRPLHGSSGNHNPFVPTVNAIAMWGTADVFRNGEQVRDDAPVHIMLTSDTRGENFRYQCYDCFDRPMEELHMMLMPHGDTEKYDAPGGFLHIMWEKARSDVRRIG